MIQQEDDLRTGKATMNDLHDDYDKGLITKKDEDAIRKNVMATREMDAATARLYTRASRLPMKDFLQVWDVATPPERTALHKLLVKKREAYYKNADDNMAPVARQQDRVYQRLRGMQRGGNGQPISGQGKPGMNNLNYYEGDYGMDTSNPPRTDVVPDPMVPREQ
jgi:hypothetical protein